MPIAGPRLPTRKTDLAAALKHRAMQNTGLDKEEMTAMLTK
eukprot:gene9173-8263_t